LDKPSQSHRDHTIQVYPRSKQGVGQVLGRSIRTDRYRLVQWKAWDAPEQSSDWELYDYQTDPLETKNLADQEPQVVASMRELLAIHPAAKPQVKSFSGSQTTAGESKETDRESLFAKKDTDADGFLSHAEFMSGQKDPEQAKQRFGKFDVNGDGKLSRKEFVSSGKSSD
jgi:iduronate 2-sulfatase